MVVPKFSKILVPLDGSELSIQAEFAISVAKKQDDDNGRCNNKHSCSKYNTRKQQ
jgi:hypothetical protein